MRRHTNEPGSETKNHIDLTYFTGFLGHYRKICLCTLSVQVFDLSSPNLYSRCIWHGCTSWQIHSQFDLFSGVTGVKM